MDDLKLAQELYEDAMSATREQRQQVEEDLRFSDPSDPQQWDDVVKRERETDPGGARPCLVMDHTGQYVANVAGQVAKNPPSIHTVPVDGGSDIKVSEQIDGILRQIEYASRAQTHYAIALTSAARTGVGYLVIRPEYTDRALGYQEPRIASQPDPLRVVFDPWSIQLDGSDADFAYLLTTISEREFKRRWPDQDPVSFGMDYRNRSAATDDRKQVVIAEQWLRESKTAKIIVYTDAQGEDASGSEEDYWRACKAAGLTLPVERIYDDKTTCIRWRTMSGSAILESAKGADGEEAYYPAESIGVVPVYGYWGVKDGRLTYCGIPRRARNPQRAYNYHMSEQLAYMGTAPRSPWIASRRAIRGLEQVWERASVESRAFLPYNDMDEDGAIATPQRASVSANLQNHLQGAQQALADIEASTGMYRANLGAPSNETSGVAIDARKEQGEAAVSHFPQNLSASLAQVGRVCLQMIPKLVDTKRVQRILGIDGKPGQVTIDPEQEQAHEQDEQGISINPNVGQYDVRVVVGASYSTQRSQTQEALSQVMQANPNLTPAIAPLWAQQLDFAHADKLAQVLTAMSPPAVQAILNPDTAGKPTVEQLLAQTQQMQQAIQHMQQAGAQLQAENQELKSSREAEEGKLMIDGYKAMTERMQLVAPAMTPQDIAAIVVQAMQSAMQQPQPMPPDVDDGKPGGELPEPIQPPPMNPPSAGFSLPEGMPQ